MNPYKVLGVSENATQEEIRGIFRACEEVPSDRYQGTPSLRTKQ